MAQDIDEEVTLADVVLPKSKTPYKYKPPAPGAKLDPRNDRGLYDRIFRCASMRMTKEEAALICGVHVTNFRAFLKRDPKAEEAWENGRQMFKVSVRRMVLAHAKDDPTTARYLANNELGYSNDPAKNRAIEESGVTINNINRDEAIQRITELQGQLKDVTPRQKQLASTGDGQ